MPPRLILGIETSCDETSAAVIRYEEKLEQGTGTTTVLSNVVASQLIHSSYGGVVPELASREHLRAIVPVTREAMAHASAAFGQSLTYAGLDAIAVTAGPGLAGALLVGITFAKSLAFAANKPLIAVNHLEGHIHAVLMDTATQFNDRDPLLALVVSGGHTHLYLASRTPQQTWRYRNVGKTLDDAAGEAFDKVAKLLGLPYPGGPWIDALAPYGDPRAVPFTIAQIKTKATGNTAPKLAVERAMHALKGRDFKKGHLHLDGSERATFALKGRDFSPAIENSDASGFSRGGNAGSTLDARRFDLSFSGIKTAVRRYVELHSMREQIDTRAAALRAANLSTASPRDTANLTAALSHFDAPTLDLIASFQASVTATLTRTTLAAATHFGAQGLLVSGGVAANSELRRRLTEAAAAHRLPIAFPTIALSTDNAAMIAAAALPKLLIQDFAPDTLEHTPQLRLG